ncbi:hypothetical protein BOTBODRAFT_172406 [Botryobasidium botryosum FD-172 SS1]|uniref:Uncharacterized protein n=1 Tax=Botryobasidium botryosum (strain FD-172 SS1) TaxID=930990 RepID=A0A067MPA8_BOTB1|nr:hypothetical protein BOTBODRAFT_172406 [Botryobasidium botryosum FD-172 SS1]
MHHITGQATYASLDGVPFFCPIPCDPCSCPGFHRIPDPDCPCHHCTSLSHNTTPINVVDQIIQHHCHLFNATNLRQDNLQNYSNYNLLDHAQLHPHPSQENLPELTFLARQRAHHAIESNDQDTAHSWGRYRRTIHHLSNDIDGQHRSPSQPRHGYRGYVNHSSSFVDRHLGQHQQHSFHPRSTDIPGEAVNSILEIFHYSIPRTQIVDIMLDNPDFMALLTTHTKSSRLSVPNTFLLPTPQPPPPPQPPPLPAAVVAAAFHCTNWCPGQAKPAISYALAAATTPTRAPNPTPKRITPFITRKGSNCMATNEATFKPLGRVTLQTHGTAIIDHFNNSAQASAIEARITSVSWSRNGNSCPILKTVFGVPFRALYPGEIFGTTVRDITLCHSTQGDQYSIDELIVQIIDTPVNRVDPTTLADNHCLSQSAERITSNPNQLTVGLIVNFITKEARNQFITGVNNSHKIVMNGTQYSIVTYKQLASHPAQCTKCWSGAMSNPKTLKIYTKN